MTERRQGDPAELLREVEPGWDAAKVERALDVQLRAMRRRRFVRGTAATLAAAAALLLAWQVWPSGEVERAEAPVVDGRRPVELADGSRLVPTDGGALEMHEVSETRVRASLAAGALEVDIVPRPGREIRIEVGEVTVTVLGTAFRITRHDGGEGGAQVEVAVHRGLVAVDYVARDGEAIRAVLGAGESGRFPPAPSELITDEPTASTPSSGEPTASVVPPSEVLATAPSDRPRRPAEEVPAAAEAVVPSRGWRDLAERGEFDEAYVALDGAGPAAAPNDLDGLLLAADAARLSGHPREALPYLERAEASAAGDPRAPLAAFSSGRILAQLGRHDEAASAFERVLRLEPAGSLAEDAMVRAAEAHQRAGHDASARTLAERYLAAHPDGRGAARMRALLP